MSEFKKELEALLNRVNAEGGSDTPDFVLAEYLSACLDAFDKGVLARERWYNRTAKRGDYRPGFVDPESEEAKPRKFKVKWAKKLPAEEAEKLYHEAFPPPNAPILEKVTGHPFITTPEWRKMAGVHENDKYTFCGYGGSSPVCMRSRADHVKVDECVDGNEVSRVIAAIEEDSLKDPAFVTPGMKDAFDMPTETDTFDDMIRDHNFVRPETGYEDQGKEIIPDVCQFKIKGKGGFRMCHRKDADHVAF